MNGKKSIVVLGAGFGGLRAALEVEKKIRRGNLADKAEVILIDRNAYHTYTPTLYEAATTSKDTATYQEIKQIVTFSIPEIIARTGIKFIQSEIKSLELKDGDVHLADGQMIKFDSLVLALGAETNWFGIPGLKENSLPLKTFIDSIKIRDRIFELMQSDKSELKILIGGGGSTGVELAGEIHGWVSELQQELKSRCRLKISIIEGSSSLMLGFPLSIIRKIEKRLKKLGTELVTGELITKVSPEKISLKSGTEIPYDLLVWTGGVKASSLMGTMPLKIEPRGRVEVASEMECLPATPDLKLYGKIYAIGDIVCFINPKTGKPIPGVARAALSQADIVAHNIWRDLTGRKDHAKYKPMEYPYVIPVGGKWAVAKLGPIVIYGFPGWILKGLVEINYLISILSFWRAVRLWLKGLLVFIKNDRLG